jgi:hypothetical protein
MFAGFRQISSLEAAVPANCATIAPVCLKCGCDRNPILPIADAFAISGFFLCGFGGVESQDAG